MVSSSYKVLSKSTLSKYAVFDGQQLGVLPALSFSRNVATKKWDNSSVNANSPRYGKQACICHSPSWYLEFTDSQNHNPAAFGYASDGITSIGLLFYSGNKNLKIFQNEDIINAVRTRSCIRTDDSGTTDLLAGLANQKDYVAYNPVAATICFGAMFILCARSHDLNQNKQNRNWQEQGVTLFISQDMGVTWTGVQDTTGTEDLAGVTGSAGVGRGREWAMASAFPETATPGQAWLSALLSFTDYCANPNSPGGQAFLLRLTRTAVGQNWTLETIRKTLEIVDSGTHFHSACAFRTGNVIYQYVMIGDSIGRHGIREVKIADATNYTTGTITARSVHGGQTSLGDAKKFGNQGISPIPGTDNNSWIMGGDDDNDQVVKVTRPVDDNSMVTISSLFGNTTAGYGNWNALFMSCGDLKNRKDYLVHVFPGSPTAFPGSNKGSRILYSPDGVNFGTVRSHTGTSGHGFFFGTKMLQTKGNGEGTGLYSAAKPAYALVQPIAISAGGQNYINATTPTVFQTSSGVTVTQLTRDANGKIVNPLTGVAFAEQPPCDGPIFRIQQTIASTSAKLCRIKLTTSNVVPQGIARCRFWVRSLIAGAGTTLRTRLNAVVSAETLGVYKDYDLRHTDGFWNAVEKADDLTAAGANYTPDVELWISSSDQDMDTDIIVALDGWYAGANPFPYPVPFNTNGPNEIATIDISGLKTNDRKIAVTCRVPKTAWDSHMAANFISGSTPAMTPLFCAKQDNNNYVTVWADITNATIKAEVVGGGISLGTPNALAYFVQEDLVKVILRINNAGVNFDAIVGGADMLSASLSAANTIAPTILNLATNHDQSVVGSIDFFAIEVSDNIGEYEPADFDYVDSVSSLVTTPSDGQVGLSWTAPSDLPNITDYAIQYRVKGTSSWTTKSHGSTSTSETITGLVNSTIYEFRVAPITLLGIVGSYEFTQDFPRSAIRKTALKPKVGGG